MLLDRYERGLRHAERTFAVAEATGQGQRLPVLFWTGTVRTMVGRLREAAEVLDTAIEIARVAGHEQGMMWNLFARAFTALAAGDNATALSAAREATAVMRAVERSFPATGAGHALAAALLAHDDAAGAREALIDACGEELGTSPRPGARAPSSCSPASSSRSAQRARRRGGGRRRRRGAARAAPVAAMADRAAAHVALAGAPARAASQRRRLAPGRLAAAASPPPHAATPHRTPPRHPSPAPPTRPSSRCAPPPRSPSRRARRGRRSRARSPAARSPPRARPSAPPRSSSARRRSSSAATRSASATPASASCARLGRRGRYRRTKAVGDGSLIGSLTERELQIARLVVDRRTNAEIAAELYLSTKTVETHLRNLFHKLGVSSRVEVARVVERADAASPAGPAAS